MKNLPEISHYMSSIVPVIVPVIIPVISGIWTFFTYILSRGEQREKEDIEKIMKYEMDKEFRKVINNSSILKMMFFNSIRQFKDLGDDPKAIDIIFAKQNNEINYNNFTQRLVVLLKNKLISCDEQQDDFILTDKAKKFYFSKKSRKYGIGAFILYALLIMLGCVYSDMQNISPILISVVAISAVAIPEIWLLNHLDKIKYLHDFKQRYYPNV